MIIIKGYEEALNYIRNEYARVSTLAKEEVPKVMKVVQCNFQHTWGAHRLDIKNYFATRAPDTVEAYNSQLTKYLAELDEEKRRLLSLHEANLPAIENNKRAKAKAVQIMKAIGIPDTYTERDYTSKARTPKYTSKSAGYLGDLQRNVPESDGYESAVREADEAARQAREYVQKQVTFLEQKKREAAAEEKKRKDALVIVHMRVKYECEPDASPRMVLEAILNKNKYLRLAHYLELNRGDWSSGCDYAEIGLDGFSVETPLDKEIYDRNRELCNDWDGDGRVFRDNERNYSTVFALVDDDKLMKDYLIVKEMIEW